MDRLPSGPGGRSALMLPYWGLFVFSAVLALLPVWRPNTTRGVVVAIVLSIFLVIFVGLRFNVGGDWVTYDRIFLEVNRLDLFEALAAFDSLYSLINWVVGNLGGDIWHVNLICAAVFTYGLCRLCMTFPYPAVGWLTAVPFLIIVVAMGFTRQGASIGCLMAAIASYEGRLTPRLLLWSLAALGFHKSAILFLPIFVFATTRNRVVSLIAGAVTGVLFLAVFVLGNVGRFLDIYVEAEMQSSGAAVRLALGLVSAILYFLFIDRAGVLGERQRLWRYTGFLALLLLPVYLYSTSSTVVDRVAYFLLPFQLMTFGYLPYMVRRSPMAIYVVISGIIMFNFVIFFTWLYFADNANYWIPYRNVLFEPYLRVF